jgi:hypothetical protein
LGSDEKWFLIEKKDGRKACFIGTRVVGSWYSIHSFEQKRMLLSEEAIVLAMFLGNNRQAWKPRILELFPCA